MEASELLAMALKATEKNNDEHVKILSYLRPKYKGITVIKTKNDLCYIIPEGMSRLTYDKIKSKNWKRIQKFKNDKNEKQLKL